MPGKQRFRVFTTYVAALCLAVSMLLSYQQPAFAADACTATVDPTSIQANAQGVTFTISLTNTGPQPIIYIQLDRPSADFTMANVSASGWSVSANSSHAELTGGSLASGATLDFTFSATVGPNEASAADWSVQTYASEGVISCTGSLGTAIVGVGDVTPPVVSEHDVSNITQTTATISWTTDENTISYVEYGPTVEYGILQQDPTPRTTHTFNLTELLPGTTYYLYSKNTDDSGNFTYGEDVEFTTPAAPTTAPGAPTNTPAPTSKPSSGSTTAPDTTGPSISLATSTARPFSGTPTLSGSATDASSITSISYSLDGAAYVPATSGGAPNAKSASFSIALSGIDAGSHTLSIRATDSAGNSSTITRSFTVDLTAPEIELITDIGIGYADAPLVEGVVTDNTGVASVEYSLDGGANYLPAEVVFETSRAEGTFSFQPEVVVEGNYPLVIRTADTAGNISEHKPGEIIIDRLPPKIGLVTLSAGPLMLRPLDHVFQVAAGHDYTVILSAAGGPNHITLTIGDTSYDMAYVQYQDVWKATIPITATGEQVITAYAVDGAGNEETKDLMSLDVIAPGQISGYKGETVATTVTLYHRSAEGEQFTVWPGSAYAQPNPRQLQSNDRLSYILPAGTYYIEVTAAGHRTARSEQFTLDSTTIVSPSVTLEPVKALRLGKFAIPLPYLRAQSFTVDVPTATSTSDHVVGQSLPADLNLPVFGAESLTPDRLAGKSTLISIISDWSPDKGLQLGQLEALASQSEMESIVVITEISPVEAAVLKKRGHYLSHIVADQDGIISDNVGITSTPTHLLLGRDGRQVIGALTGFASTSQLEEIRSESRR